MVSDKMVTVEIINDGSGNQIEGNYDVTITINDMPAWMGRIERHDRRKGWRGLLARVSDAVWDRKAAAAGLPQPRL